MLNVCCKTLKSLSGPDFSPSGRRSAAPDDIPRLLRWLQALQMDTECQDVVPGRMAAERARKADIGIGRPGMAFWQAVVFGLPCQGQTRTSTGRRGWRTLAGRFASSCRRRTWTASRSMPRGSAAT